MAPELAIRRMLHALGYRFRLHRKDLPGKPDLVFPSRRAVLFVHGCFWHQHQNCKIARIPRTNLDYWVPKLARNVERDAQNQKLLAASGWRSMIVWECQTQDPKVHRRLIRFLDRAAR